MTGAESSLVRRKSEAGMAKEHIRDGEHEAPLRSAGRGDSGRAKDGRPAEEPRALCRGVSADAVIKDTVESVRSGGGLAL